MGCQGLHVDLAVSFFLFSSTPLHSLFICLSETVVTFILRLENMVEAGGNTCLHLWIPRSPLGAQGEQIHCFPPSTLHPHLPAPRDPCIARSLPGPPPGPGSERKPAVPALLGMGQCPAPTLKPTQICHLVLVFPHVPELMTEQRSRVSLRDPGWLTRLTSQPPMGRSNLK